MKLGFERAVIRPLKGFVDDRCDYNDASIFKRRPASAEDAKAGIARKTNAKDYVIQNIR